ncbi:hypothetical protein FHS21_004694 [Phyllobacterium trifolii]|jgi:hypothetical protein|uniref:Uncharacterized protein n=1 Tax=Phyllobacterium trifolii TaxID=300193 RepID=A0A839UHY8_9HYPH|nr:hypothetical protein [Phyllobacterium trifolii]
MKNTGLLPLKVSGGHAFVSNGSFCFERDRIQRVCVLRSWQIHRWFKSSNAGGQAVAQRKKLDAIQTRVRPEGSVWSDLIRRPSFKDRALTPAPLRRVQSPRISNAR